MGGAGGIHPRILYMSQRSVLYSQPLMLSPGWGVDSESTYARNSGGVSRSTQLEWHSPNHRVCSRGTGTLTLYAKGVPTETAYYDEITKRYPMLKSRVRPSGHRRLGLMSLPSPSSFKEMLMGFRKPREMTTWRSHVGAHYP